MNENEMTEESALAALFAAAKADDPVPSGDLMARIIADAVTVQSQTQTATMPPVLAAPKGVFQVLSEVFGGWAGASTLAVCVGLGLVLGFLFPDTILSYVPSTVLDAGDDAFGLYFDAEL